MWPCKWKSADFAAFQTPLTIFFGQTKACLHTFSQYKLVTPNDSSKQKASFKD